MLTAGVLVLTHVAASVCMAILFTAFAIHIKFNPFMMPRTRFDAGIFFTYVSTVLNSGDTAQLVFRRMLGIFKLLVIGMRRKGFSFSSTGCS